MLQNIKPLYGRALGATDGAIGHVRDFYFDDLSWVIRYVVADTGSWLPGRRVLLPPHAFRSDALSDRGDREILRVSLTRKQIEDSPSIDRHRPVAQPYEEDYPSFYGWPVYWQDPGMGDGLPHPLFAAPPLPKSRPHPAHQQRADVHLRSTKDVGGYAIEALDGRIGSVQGFLVNGATWKIRELVAEIGHWYAGKAILILTDDVTRISYEDSAVVVNLTKEDLEQTNPDDVAHPAQGSSSR